MTLMNAESSSMATTPVPYLFFTRMAALARTTTSIDSIGQSTGQSATI